MVGFRTEQGVRFDPDLPQTLRLEFAKTNTKISKQRHYTPHYQPFHGPPPMPPMPPMLPMPPMPPPHYMPHPPPPPPAFHSPGSTAGSAFGSLTGLNGIGVGAPMNMNMNMNMNYGAPPANSNAAGASSVTAALQQALNNAAAASYIGSFGPRTTLLV